MDPEESNSEKEEGMTTYDEWKTTEPDPWEHDDRDFCLIHGFQFMYAKAGDPIAHCSECEREGAGVVTME
jgi:hypothetical protein